MAHWLRTLDTLAESFIPSTHTTHNYLELQSQGFWCPLLAHTCGRHTRTCTHTNKITLKKEKSKGSAIYNEEKTFPYSPLYMVPGIRFPT